MWLHMQKEAGCMATALDMHLHNAGQVCRNFADTNDMNILLGWARTCDNVW